MGCGLTAAWPKISLGLQANSMHLYRGSVVVALFASTKELPAPIRYGAALALVAAGAGCNYLLPGVYGNHHYFFFSASVLASALMGGVGPGLLATVASALASAYFFVYPFYSVRVEATEAAQRLALFLLEGTIISTVGQVIRGNRTPELVSTFGRYGSAVALVAGACVLKLLILPDVGRHTPFTFFYSAIVAAAWIAGAAPGMLATALSAASVHYLFATAAPITPGNPALVLFALEGTVLCLITATFRERLVETEAHLGRVFEDSPLGILILEGGSGIRKANPAFRQFLGKLLPAGTDLMDLVHPDSKPRLRDFRDRLIREQTVSKAEEICFPTGANMVWGNLHGSRIRENSGTAATCMVMVEDITERRKTEEALKAIEARLRRGEKMEALGLLAGGVAHDFNNLLSNTFGCCENLLARKELLPESRRYVEEILQTAKTAANMTGQLLSFARRRPIGQSIVGLNRVIEDTVGLLQRLIGSRIVLKTELAPDAGMVRADPSQLQQVLMNLAANARDAMPISGRLTIRTLRAHYSAILEISDTGHGMDEAVQARIFEPLFTTKDLDEGTGLGLATVHSIVKRLGGSISVESVPDHGTTFFVYLPVVDPGVTGGAADAMAVTATVRPTA